MAGPRRQYAGMPLMRDPPDVLAGHELKPHELYRSVAPATDGFVDVAVDARFDVGNRQHYDPFLFRWDGRSDPVPAPSQAQRHRLYWMRRGTARGPPVVLLHGVPTSSLQNVPLMDRLAPFCDVVNYDMLAMGRSSAPLNGVAYTWAMDAFMLLAAVDAWFAGNPHYRTNGGRFFLVADDWGGGIAATFATLFPSRLTQLTLIDPIAFDGYEVPEIGAIGRAAVLLATPADRQAIMGKLGGDAAQATQAQRIAALEALWRAPKVVGADFQQAMGAFDETVAQIMKTMVAQPRVFNAYNLRDLLRPYKDIASYYGAGVGPSVVRGLDFAGIAALALRAANLNPDLLLPYHPTANPYGLSFERVDQWGGASEATADFPVQILWGAEDNMMPPAQRHRYAAAWGNVASVRTELVPQAGHFAAVDQPDWVAEQILDFVRQTYGTGGPNGLADVFQGYVTTLQKGDGAAFRDQWRRYYDLPE